MYTEGSVIVPPTALTVRVPVHLSISGGIKQVCVGRQRGRDPAHEWHWPLWLCCAGSTVRGEWGTAHIRADLHRRPGHAHEDRDDVARHIRPGLQAESRAHRAGVGGAGGAKSWEKRRTRQWNGVSQDGQGPQGSTGSRIIWLLLYHHPFLGFPDPKNLNCPPFVVWIPNRAILLLFYLKLQNDMLQMAESAFILQQ